MSNNRDRDENPKINVARNGSEALYQRIRTISTELEQYNTDIRGRSDYYKDYKTIYDYLDNVARLQLRKSSSIYSTKSIDDAVDPEADKIGLKPSKFGNQISYLHNEFYFDAAKPLQPFALVTHISFVPIYKPKWRRSRWPREPGPASDSLSLSPMVESILDNLKKDAVNKCDDFSKSESEDLFRGGKDKISQLSTTILSYGQKYVTTRRSIMNLYSNIRRTFTTSVVSDPELLCRIDTAERAFKFNDDFHELVLKAGLSSRLSMIREFALRLSACGLYATRLNWVRHHSHYQTLTAIEEAGTLCESLDDLSSDTRYAALTLQDLLVDLKRLDGSSYPVWKKENRALLARTAFHGFPPKWADHLYGRYLQGANYLVLPLSCLFSTAYLDLCNNDGAGSRKGSSEFSERWKELLDYFPDFGVCERPNFETVLRCWRSAPNEAGASRAAANFMFAFLSPLGNAAFSSERAFRDIDICMSEVSDGGALIISNVKNFGGQDDGTQGEPFMSQTLVLDLGMNSHERGRLLKSLTEFSTQRFLALTSLGNFRFVHDALDTIHEDLNDAVANWMKGAPNSDAASADRPSDAVTKGKKGGHKGLNREERKAEVDLTDTFIKELRTITLQLTVLNDLVEGGISAHSQSAEAASRRVRTRLSLISERKIPGFMSLGDFIERRVSKSSQSIAGAGRRYERLRHRISEFSGLAETQLEMFQNEAQKKILEKIDRLTLFGIVYYLGTVLADVIGPLYALLKHGKFEEKNLNVVTDAVKTAIFFLLLLVVIFIGQDVRGNFAEEWAEAGDDWKKGTIAAAARRTLLFLLGELKTRSVGPAANT